MSEVDFVESGEEGDEAMTIKDKISASAQRGKDKASEFSGKAKANYADAKAKAKDQVASARQSASEAYGKTREKGSALYADGKAKASAGYDRGRKQIDSTPLAVIAGGLAIGAIVGALIPESQREKRAMGTTGRKINNRAKEAMTAAKDRGQEKIDELGLSTDSLKKQMEEFVSKGVEILKSAGTAAGDAARHKK